MNWGAGGGAGQTRPAGLRGLGTASCLGNQLTFLSISLFPRFWPGCPSQCPVSHVFAVPHAGSSNSSFRLGYLGSVPGASAYNTYRTAVVRTDHDAGQRADELRR